MLGAIVDDFVVTEWAMSFGAVLISSFTLKVRYRECEQMTCSTLWALRDSRHLDPMFTHS